MSSASKHPKDMLTHIKTFVYSSKILHNENAYWAFIEKLDTIKGGALTDEKFHAPFRPEIDRKCMHARHEKNMNDSNPVDGQFSVDCLQIFEYVEVKSVLRQLNIFSSANITVLSQSRYVLNILWVWPENP